MNLIVHQKLAVERTKGAYFDVHEFATMIAMANIHANSKVLLADHSSCFLSGAILCNLSFFHSEWLLFFSKVEGRKRRARVRLSRAAWRQSTTRAATELWIPGRSMGPAPILPGQELGQGDYQWWLRTAGTERRGRRFATTGEKTENRSRR